MTSSSKTKSWKIVALVLLFTLLPPLLILPILRGLWISLRSGKVPGGWSFVFWIFGFTILISLPEFFLVSIHQPKLNSSTIKLLVLDSFWMLGAIFALRFNFRREPTLWTEYIPLIKRKLTPTFWGISGALVALVPLEVLAMRKLALPIPKEMTSPIPQLFAQAVSNEMFGLALSMFVSIVVMYSILDAALIRGLLVTKLEAATSNRGGKNAVYVLISLCMSLNALPHAVVSAFLVSIASFYLRLKMKSVIPPLLLHCAWSAALLVSILAL